MNDIIGIIPEKYRSTALFVLAISPYVTRAIHALTNGRGIKGTLSAIWLGTNTPKSNSDSGANTTPPNP